MKVKVEICCGTTCFMLGAGKLLKIEQNMPDAWKNQVEFSGLPCMETCTADQIGNAPFVRINGTVHGNMTVDKMTSLINGLLGETEAANV